jgi:hypothetical protein
MKENLCDFDTSVGPRALNDGLPPSVTLKAGPFISNEEAKVILTLDIPDHSATFGVFSGVVGKGLAAKRRHTPVVDWPHFDKDHEGSQITRIRAGQFESDFAYRFPGSFAFGAGSAHTSSARRKSAWTSLFIRINAIHALAAARRHSGT